MNPETEPRDAKFGPPVVPPDPQLEWNQMMNQEGWVLLSLGHPDYSIQQAFSEIACQSQETDPETLFLLALLDYEEFAPKADQRIWDAFMKWSVKQAKLNQWMADKPSWFEDD